MIDFEKEEFLQRLDLRLATISSMLAYHEKFMVQTYLKTDEYRKIEKYIDKAQTDFLNYIRKNDKEISEQFMRIKTELAKENSQNEKH